MSRRIAVLALSAVVVLAACGGDSGSDQLDVVAAIDERPIADATARSPLRLDPTEESVLSLDITNGSGSAVEVHRVRLEGELLGLNFLTYDVRVSVPLAAGEQRTVAVPLDFFDLERQASGYLRTFVRTYDRDGDRLSNNEFALDIAGSPWSTMNLFALLLLVLTALSAFRNLRDTTSGRLPANRFQRGMRFALTGLGIGLLISVAFSILRIFPLPAAGWVPLTIIPTVAGFVFGYVVTAGAKDDDGDGDGEPWEDDLDDEELAMRQADLAG
ncbi:MAG TPA: hypothetical protein VK866_03740 [Acidimicrobiales bacterium]|nr:hypothetical protein [Acidimicrobiales bacterium]